MGDSVVQGKDLTFGALEPLPSCPLAGRLAPEWVFLASWALW